MRHTVTVVVGATMAIGLMGAPAQASACPGADTAVSAQTVAETQSAVACLVNARRSSAGLGQLTDAPELGKAASGHANDMVARHFFDHVTPDGAAPLDRVKATGFLQGASSFAVGENIADGSAGSPSTPRHIVADWMDSPPHRANILDADFHFIGVGTAVGMPTGSATGGTYVADFANRSGGGAAPRAATDDDAPSPPATDGAASSPELASAKPTVRRVRRCTRKVTRKGHTRVTTKRCTVRVVRTKRTSRS